MKKSQTTKKRTTVASARAAQKQSSTTDSFPVVGIGASAGGLQAFKDLLEKLPRDTGMAFVLVQHLDPTHKSQLTDLLAPSSPMPLVEARDGITLQPNRAYVITPNTTVKVTKRNKLHVRQREKTKRNLPVDLFFQSLADEIGHRAIGVVLSGTASDGAEGVQSIKAAGGLTFAQDEQSATYPAMPHNAAATGCVDFVLEPAALAKELALVGTHAYVNGGIAHEAMPDDALLKVFRLLHARTGVDFSHYKPATIQRRVQRRMAMHRLRRVDQYAQRLKEKPGEIDALYHDLLINVTSFFRDKKVIPALKKKVLPHLLRDRSDDDPIRVWVPGCATGEEVYSLAIALSEFLAQKRTSFPVQIFGTDINEEALQKARAGIYPQTIEKDLSRERLRRYFVRTTGGFRVNADVREWCMFAPHDLNRDPPFSNLDLVSCRNLLIYLGPLLQKRVLPVFHYALKPSGFLLLGRSESIRGFSHLFSVLDKTNKLYTPKATVSHVPFAFRSSHTAPAQPAAPERGSATPLSARGDQELQKAVDRLLVGRFAPASVLVDGDMQVLQFRGRTGPYLEHEPGTANLNLLRMARDEIALELRPAMLEARKQGKPVRREGVDVVSGDAQRRVDIEVAPVRIGRAAGRYFLVMFEETETQVQREPVREQTPAQQERVDRMQQELAATKERQREVVEEAETANEELMALNEELQSSNEELESTNEELETAKEELQSANEELHTINEELQTRSAELTQTNDDLTNLLKSVDIPIMVLDGGQRVRRFTPRAESVLNLHASDLGRPIGELRLPLKKAALKRMLTDTLHAPGPEQCEVQDRQGHWYELQTRPYYTSDHRIDGALVILRDIDAAKRALLQVEAERDKAEAITEAAQTPLLVLEKDLRVRYANPAFYHTYQLTRNATEGALICELGKRNWPSEKVRKPLKRMLRGGTAMDKVEVDYEFPAVGPRTVLLSARRITEGKGGTPLLLLAMEDVTERRQLEAEILHTAEAERERIGRDLHDGVGQALPSIGYLLRATQDALERKGAPEAGQVEKAARLAEEYAQAAHDIARGLFPMEIKKGGIVAALRELGTYSEELHGLTCHVSGLTATDLTTQSVARHLYRIAQEAVNNAARHSRATTIWIRLARRKNGHVLMTIRDNGRGMPRGKGRQTGMGLRLMQYRTDLIGATLKIESTKGKGTKISCLIPPRETVEKENDAR